MDILLTHGYFLAEDPHERQIMKPYPPLGILYLSSYLKSVGFDVQVYDSTFGSMADFQALIRQKKPSVVGIYVNLMTKHNALKMIPFCKSQGCTVVVGGPDVPYYAENYLAHGADVIVRGEGEYTLADLLPAIAKLGVNRLHVIAGITFRDENGQIVETDARPQIADLSAHPWPDRDAIDMQKYLDAWQTHHGYSMVSVIHARGCPYTCTWCSHSVFGNTHRRRTPEDAANELLHIKERYNPDRIWYADDVFAINHRWLFAYADALKARGVRIPFECISRADRLNEQVIDTLVEMGCFRLWNGSESGSQRILDAMQRKVNAEDVQLKTQMLRQAGIETGMFIMLGYKDETIADLQATLDHLRKANPDILLTTVAYPIKGTPYYADIESDVLRSGDWASSSDRDLTVAGRYSRRFYLYATRWLVNGFNLHRAKQENASRLRQAKMRANVLIGRAGMAALQFTQEKETSELQLVVPTIGKTS